MATNGRAWVSVPHRSVPGVVLLSLAGSRVRASPALAGRLRAPVVRRHRRSGPRPSRASPRSATLGCRESQDPPGYSMVALEGVKRGCQADLSASTGKRKPAVAPGRAPEEQPRWFSWPQSTFHSLSPRTMLGLVEGSSRNTGRTQYSADGLRAPGPMLPATCANERGAVQLEALPSACWVLVRT